MAAGALGGRIKPLVYRPGSFVLASIDSGLWAIKLRGEGMLVIRSINANPSPPFTSLSCLHHVSEFKLLK